MSSFSAGIPITLNSDAHTPQELTAGFEFATKILRKIGYTHLNVLVNGSWREVRFGEHGLDMPWVAQEDNRPQTA